MSSEALESSYPNNLVIFYFMEGMFGKLTLFPGTRLTVHIALEKQNMCIKYVCIGSYIYMKKNMTENTVHFPFQPLYLTFTNKRYGSLRCMNHRIKIFCELIVSRRCILIFFFIQNDTRNQFMRKEA